MAGRPDHPGGVSTLPWPTLLVTRPQPQAQDWVARLKAHGAAAEALPLIATAPPQDVGAVHRLWTQLPQTRAVMFVSPAAVQHVFDARPLGAMWPQGTLAAAPGPGTAAVLEALGAAAGLPTSQILRPPNPVYRLFTWALWPVLAPLRATLGRVVPHSHLGWYAFILLLGLRIGLYMLFYSQGWLVLPTKAVP